MPKKRAQWLTAGTAREENDDIPAMQPLRPSRLPSRPRRSRLSATPIRYFGKRPCNEIAAAGVSFVAKLSVENANGSQFRTLRHSRVETMASSLKVFQVAGIISPSSRLEVRSDACLRIRRRIFLEWNRGPKL